MRRIALKMLSFALLMSSAGYAQSLGDVARASREKQKAKAASSPAKPKVITNETLPRNPDASSSEVEGKMRPVSVATASTGTTAGHQSAEEWKNRILTQKNAIANLQAQIDKVNNSIRFVVANEYSNGVQYNQHQVKKQENVAQMLQQIEEQKKILSAMQEAARQAGMGSAVYDP